MYWLERYLRDGDAYIGLSPGLDNRLAKIAWLHECMRLLAPNGRPLVKVHVFGTSSPAIAALHPFFSLDASTWFQGPCHGNILVPNAAIETDWVTTPITDGMRYSKRHFDHLLSAEQAWIRAHIKSLELEMSQVRYDVEARKVVSIIGYQTVEKRTGVTIYLVTNLSRGERETLDQHGVEHRLLSFYDLRNKSEDALQRYLTPDFSPWERQRRSPKPRDWTDTATDWRKLAVWRRGKRYENDTFT